jgi:iron-sulfur cluster assembly protein
MAITVTPTAIQQVKQVLASQGKENWGIRLGVKGGGCSGLSYTMDLTEAPEADDKILDIEGVKVYCDKKSYFYLSSLTLDYVDALMGGGFKFVNPSATATCGCGSSFSA